MHQKMMDTPIKHKATGKGPRSQGKAKKSRKKPEELGKSLSNYAKECQKQAQLELHSRIVEKAKEAVP